MAKGARSGKKDKGGLIIKANSAEGKMARMLVKAVERYGGSKADIRCIIAEEENHVWELIAETIVEGAKRIQQTIKIMVDYDRPLKDAIAAGHYDEVAPEITEEDFQRKDHERGKKEVGFRLLDIDKKIGLWDGKNVMKEQGCRPATLRELLAYGEAKSGRQQIFWTVALDAVWDRPQGGLCTVYLKREHERSCLCLYSNCCIWSESCRFLAVVE